MILFIFLSVVYVIIKFEGHSTIKKRFGDKKNLVIFSELFSLNVKL